GGDWMPLSRLVAPVLPATIVAAAEIASIAPLRFAVPRLALALAGELFVLGHIGPKAARVGGDRAAVMRELGPVLVGRTTSATVEVGWVGATTAATLLDLAGVTDPSIARLPGGHTSKKITAELLDARAADTLVLLLADGAELARPWTASAFARV